MEHPTPLPGVCQGLSTRIRSTTGGAMLTVLATMLIGGLTGCSSNSAKPTDKPSAVAPADISQDAGPPPGTLLTAEQMQDPVPRDEPPSRYGNPVSYSVFGKRYTTLKSAGGFRESGLASWYGTKFHGRRTSSGEPYDMYAMTAAHKSLPLPTYVEVHNLDNGRRAIVRVNDRGPFHRGRIIDLSYAAAVKLGVNTKGVARVEIRSLTGNDRPPTRTAKRRSNVIDINVPMSEASASAPPPPANNAVGNTTRNSGDHGGLFLQIGAFSNRTNAENLRSRLLAANIPSPNISEGRSANRTVYRLRIGPLSSPGQADALLPGLAEVGIHDTRLLEVANN